MIQGKEGWFGVCVGYFVRENHFQFFFKLNYIECSNFTKLFLFDCINNYFYISCFIAVFKLVYRDNHKCSQHRLYISLLLKNFVQHQFEKKMCCIRFQKMYLVACLNQWFWSCNKIQGYPTHSIKENLLVICMVDILLQTKKRNCNRI